MKLTPHNVSGFISLLPDEQREYDNLVRIAREYCENNPIFNHVDLPCIGQKDYLLQGDEENKEMYGVYKSGHDDLLLRFDQTQPLANFLATNVGRLKYPFNCWQYGKVWRAERAQAGRFREFYQFDMDVIEKDREVSAESIANVFVAIDNILNQIGIKHTFHISDRRIWDVITDPAERLEAMALVDKKSKMSDEKFAELLSENPNRAQIEKILSGDDGQMNNVIKILADNGVTNVKFDPTIVRGLSYYTGVVFETFVNGTTMSVSSGGAYSDFASVFDIKNTINGFGGSLGMSRIYALLKQGVISTQ